MPTKYVSQLYKNGFSLRIYWNKAYGSCRIFFKYQPYNSLKVDNIKTNDIYTQLSKFRNTINNGMNKRVSSKGC